jgi:hypothetical protein
MIHLYAGADGSDICNTPSTIIADGVPGYVSTSNSNDYGDNNCSKDMYIEASIRLIDNSCEIDAASLIGTIAGTSVNFSDIGGNICSDAVQLDSFDACPGQAGSGGEVYNLSGSAAWDVTGDNFTCSDTQTYSHTYTNNDTIDLTYGPYASPEFDHISTTPNLACTSADIQIDVYAIEVGACGGYGGTLLGNDNLFNVVLTVGGNSYNGTLVPSGYGNTWEFTNVPCDDLGGSGTIDFDWGISGYDLGLLSGCSATNYTGSGSASIDLDVVCPCSSSSSNSSSSSISSDSSNSSSSISSDSSSSISSDSSSSISSDSSSSISSDSSNSSSSISSDSSNSSSSISSDSSSSGTTGQYLEFDLIGTWSPETTYTAGTYCDQATPCVIPCSDPSAPAGATEPGPSFVTPHLGSAPIAEALDGIAQDISITVNIDGGGCETVNTTIDPVNPTPNTVTYFEFDVDDPSQNEFANVEVVTQVDKLSDYLYIPPEFEVVVSGGSVTSVSLISGGQGVFSTYEKDIEFSDGTNNFQVTTASGIWDIDSTYGSPTFGHVTSIDGTGPYNVSSPPYEPTPNDGTYTGTPSSIDVVTIDFLLEFIDENGSNSSTIETLSYSIGDVSENLDTTGLSFVDNGTSYTVTTDQGSVVWNTTYTTYLAYQISQDSYYHSNILVFGTDYTQLIDEMISSLYFDNITGDDSGYPP